MDGGGEGGAAGGSDMAGMEGVGGESLGICVARQLD